MPRLLRPFVTVILLTLLAAASADAAWFWEESSLITINGRDFTEEDVRHWWDSWREPGMDFPDDPRPFIEWQLLVNEAESMELYLEPSYRHKVEVFLKARSRLLLKKEEVDSRIRITDEDIEQRYRLMHRPIWIVTILYFLDEEKAWVAARELRDGAIPLTRLQERAEKEKWEMRVYKRQFRPRDLHDHGTWLETLQELKVGQVSDPFRMDKISVILRLDEKNEPPAGEFEKRREAVRRNIWDERQDELTRELINELRRKYEVRVDEELLARVVREDAAEEILDEPLIITSRDQIPAGALRERLQAELAARSRRNIDKVGKEKIVRGIVNSLVSDLLIARESLARDYEKKPPFQWVFEFYQRHRMIKELEKRLFAPEAAVSDEEVAGYYREHLAEYSRPGVVSIAVVKEDEKLIDRIWQEVGSGRNFFDVINKYYVTVKPARDVPVGHLQPALREVVGELAVGEVSPPFSFDGKTALVKLVERKDPEPTPLAQVRSKIEKKLRTAKYKQARKEYVQELLKRSEIEIDRQAWRELQHE